MDTKLVANRQTSNGKKIAGIAMLALLFFGGLAGGFFYFSTMVPKEKSASEGIPGALSQTEDFFVLRVYYPIGNQLQIEERKTIKKRGLMAVAEATLEEYLKGPLSPAKSIIPQNTKVLGIYKGADRILYIDLSDDFRRNFQGDALTEFLLLKSLHESLVSNVEDIQDVKILIEGKEVETLGGHLYLLHPLKDMVSYGS